MHHEGFFFQAFIYLTAAVLSVPLAKRLGLGSVLGYLIAGAIIGPSVLGLVGDEQTSVLHFAEFGVVLMLFVIGLELQPSLLWKMRGSILGMGGLQVGASTALIAGVSMALGLSWSMALAVGMTLALSSTAIVLQTLNEKGLMKTEAGQSCFSVLLFQDIAVIPMLALMPLLASPELVAPLVDNAGHGSGEHLSFTETLAGWQRALLVIGSVSVIVLAGRFLVRPAFSIIAETRLREIFTAAALLIVVGIALLMEFVGLSPALGTFLAGVVLAESEYRHELETDIEPFKGLLLGLFFIAVGASIDFQLLFQKPLLVLSLVAALVVGKFLVLVGVARLFRIQMGQNLLFSFALAQGGEFAFVLFSFALQNQVLTQEITQLSIVVVALSMVITPILMIANELLIQPRFAEQDHDSREADVINEENPVIVAGFGRFGQIVTRLLQANHISATVLDHDARHIDMLRQFGWKVFYGDAGRVDLLRSAGAEHAKLLIIAIDDKEHALEMVKHARKHFPNLKILARAIDRRHAYELLQLGVDGIQRETFQSSLEMGVSALQILGFRSHQAHRMARTFRHYDEAYLQKLFRIWGDEKNYVQGVKQYLSDVETVLKTDRKELHLEVDPAWEGSEVREDVTEESS